MSGTVRAAFFDGLSRLKLDAIEIGSPAEGEVLIDVRASGVCGSDLHQFLGRWDQPQFVPGHEISGVVTAIGPNVEKVQPGDRVCVEPFIYCGRCRYCQAGRYFMCPDMGFLTLTAHGGFAEQVIAPAYALYRLPDTVSLEIGALCEPCAVGVHAARLAEVCPADEVLVLGAGTIGLMALAAAKHYGARKVCVTARHPHQAEIALALGADAVLPPDRDALLTEVGTHFADGPSVILEAVGSAGKTFQDALDVAGKLGRIALMGGNTGTIDSIDLAPVVMKELVIYGSGCYSQIGTQRDFEIALDVLASRPAEFEALITHRFDLESVQSAFETALDKDRSKAVKVMIIRDGGNQCNRRVS